MGLLQLSSMCSAGCSHCPFTEKGRFHTLAEIESAMTADNEPLLTLTGGEPLEFDNLDAVLTLLSTAQRPFRIATGGHRPLEPLIDKLETSPLFFGISLGTDVISERNSNTLAKQIWTRNLELLSHRKINWSLTLTIGEGLEWKQILDVVMSLAAKPQFIMLNANEGDTLDFEKEKAAMARYLLTTKWKRIGLR